MQYESPAQFFEKVREVLQEELDTSHAETLRKQLAKIDAFRYELAEMRVDWLKKLSSGRARLLMPKDKEFTDFDRKIMLDGATIDIERDYEFLLQLEEIVKGRLELGITILQTL